MVLSLFQYKYTSEYLLCRLLQLEQTGTESLNFLTVAVVPCDIQYVEKTVYL